MIIRNSREITQEKTHNSLKKNSKAKIIYQLLSKRLEDLEMFFFKVHKQLNQNMDHLIKISNNFMYKNYKRGKKYLLDENFEVESVRVVRLSCEG